MLIERSPRVAAPQRPRLASRTLPLTLATVAAGAVILCGVEVALLYSRPEIAPGTAIDPSWVAVVFPAVSLIYVAAGLVAAWRRPSNRIGMVMIAGGLTWAVAGLVNTDVPALIAAGLIAATLPLAVVVHLLHIFPSGRLRGWLSQATVLVGYLVCLVLQAPVYLFGQGSDGPAAVLAIADRHDLARAGFWVQTGVGAAVMAVTAVILAGRLRSAERRQRLVLGPLYLYGIFAVLFVPVSGSVKVLGPWSPDVLTAVQLGVLAVVPVAFAVAVLRGGFARTSEIEELGAWLGADRGGRPGLRDALADALGDRSLELLFWAQGAGGYVDGTGRSRSLPVPGSDRAAARVRKAGGPVGAIVYDARLIDDPELVARVGRVIALAMDHERLTADLRASHDSLRRSRVRIVEAADDERRRIASNLHDGLQTRLVLLAVEAQRAETDPSAPPDARTAAASLGAGLQTAIEELRELARGVMPPALAQGGLYAAAEDLADRAPIPVELELRPAAQRLPPRVESAGYFLVSEAVANAIKHSGARALRVHLGERGGLLRIEVADDGVGGAGAADGAGMRGMTDRIEAHGGRLVVESPPGGGTRILAEVPCEP